MNPSPLIELNHLGIGKEGNITDVFRYAVFLISCRISVFPQPPALKVRMYHHIPDGGIKGMVRGCPGKPHQAATGSLVAPHMVTTK